MAILNRTALKTLIEDNIRDNTDELITPQKMREVCDSIVDSLVSIISDKEFYGLNDWQSTISYNSGDCVVRNGDIYQALSDTTIGFFIDSEWQIISTYIESTAGLDIYLHKSNAIELTNKQSTQLATDATLTGLESGYYIVNSSTAITGLDQDYPEIGLGNYNVIRGYSANTTICMFYHLNNKNIYFRFENSDWIQLNNEYTTLSTGNGVEVYSDTINLGGDLTKNTTIDCNSNTYNFKIENVNEFAITGNKMTIDTSNLQINNLTTSTPVYNLSLNADNEVVKTSPSIVAIDGKNYENLTTLNGIATGSNYFTVSTLDELKEVLENIIGNYTLCLNNNIIITEQTYNIAGDNIHITGTELRLYDCTFNFTSNNNASLYFHNKLSCNSNYTLDITKDSGGVTFYVSYLYNYYTTNRTLTINSNVDMYLYTDSLKNILFNLTNVTHRANYQYFNNNYANNIFYNNSSSGLAATNVQDAVDEIVNNVKIYVTASTKAQLLAYLGDNNDYVIDLLEEITLNGDAITIGSATKTLRGRALRFWSNSTITTGTGSMLYSDNNIIIDYDVTLTHSSSTAFYWFANNITNYNIVINILSIAGSFMYLTIANCYGVEFVESINTFAINNYYHQSNNVQLCKKDISSNYSNATFFSPLSNYLIDNIYVYNKTSNAITTFKIQNQAGLDVLNVSPSLLANHVVLGSNKSSTAVNIIQYVALAYNPLIMNNLPNLIVTASSWNSGIVDVRINLKKV